MGNESEKTLAVWLSETAKTDRKSYLIYKTGKSVNQSKNLSELAKKFRMDGRVQSDKEIFYLVNRNQSLVTYKETGAFWYMDFTKLNIPAYRPVLPQKKEAQAIAEGFLKENGLMPANAIFDGIQEATFEQVEGKLKENRTQYANHICIQYRCLLNDIQTYGPGAKIKVYIGDKGEVIGLFHAIPSIRKYKEFPSLKGENLATLLQEKLRLPLEKLMVKNARIAYHTESCVYKKNFVYPVLVFDLKSEYVSKRGGKTIPVEFEMHPVPLTDFVPVVTIKIPDKQVTVKRGEMLDLSVNLRGGTAPYSFIWESDKDGCIGTERDLKTRNLSVAHRSEMVTSHTIKVTVTDTNGLQDSHQVLVAVEDPVGLFQRDKITPIPVIPDDPYVGVEWCNIYNGAPGLGDISGTDESARGFKNHIQSLSGWSCRFDWGNNNAWEQDFKNTSAPGGGDDTNWADNVHFAFFAGHGSPGSFYFGSSVDDHEMSAQDARLGDGILNWLVLHACQTMRNNFEWDVWCDTFKGLHQMFGFHTNTQGSSPPLGSRFAFWLSFRIFPWTDAFDMQTAWRVACTECFDSSREYAVIYAGQSGTDTQNDHLPGYGHVSSDPVSPNYWCYFKGSC